MRTAAIRQVLAQRARLLGVGLAIFVGVAFLTATLLFGVVIEQGFRNAVGQEYRHIDLVAESRNEPFTAGAIAEIQALDNVAAVQAGSPTYVELRAGGRSGSLSAVEVPGAGPMRDALDLESGRLPEAAGEITLLRALARELRLDTGDTVELVIPNATGIGAGDPEVMAIEVVGIWTGAGRFGPDEITGFLSFADIAALGGRNWIGTLYVTADEGIDTGALVDTISASAAGTAFVTTSAQQIDEDVRGHRDATAATSAGIAAFGVIALIVAGIVVANTFAILVAQRTREIGLFRCAGATAGQVRRMVLAEAITVGGAASAAGVAGSLLITNLALAIVAWRWDFDGVPSSVGASFAIVTLPFLAGLAVAIAAAWGPARTATRIDPLQALRIAQLPVDASARPDTVQAAFGGLASLVGLGLMTLGVFLSRAGSLQLGVLTGVLGGLATWLGVMLGAAVLVPASVAVVSRIAARIGGLPGQVAASNSRRNPRRTTATTIALVIGVALVTMMSVGADSLKATLFNEVDVRTPWDFQVNSTMGEPGAFARFAETARDVDGVAALATFGRQDAQVVSAGTRPEEAVVFDASVVDATSLADVWRDDAALAGLGAGAILSPGWLFEWTGVPDGGSVTLSIGGADRSFQLIAVAGLDTPLVAESDLPASTALPAAAGFWVRLDDDVDADRVLDDIYDLADAQGLTIDAGDASGYRQTLSSALDALLLVITALLGVAVLIAVIGVGNTLSLSVIERTRESALLRALGFTRRQLRQALAIEGALLALVGTLIGIVLGTAFGWIGAMTLVGDSWPLALAFPLGRVALITVVALSCGLVASVLPARRGVRADPVVALADV